jgi:hypothetical protein
MYRREPKSGVRQWSTLRRLARRYQAVTGRHVAASSEIERIVRRAHRRLLSHTPADFQPALPGLENRLYALFAE